MLNEGRFVPKWLTAHGYVQVPDFDALLKKVQNRERGLWFVGGKGHKGPQDYITEDGKMFSPDFLALAIDSKGVCRAGVVEAKGGKPGAKAFGGTRLFRYLKKPFFDAVKKQLAYHGISLSGVWVVDSRLFTRYTKTGSKSFVTSMFQPNKPKARGSVRRPKP